MNSLALSGIYEIANTVNGSRYLGSAKKLSARFSMHKSQLRNGVHPNRHLMGAWNKYGEASFVFRPLLVCSPDNLLFYEQRSFDVYKPEYNIDKIAGSSFGLKRSEETKAKISAAKKGVKLADGGSNSAKARTGLKFTEERKAKISAAKKGQKYKRRISSERLREIRRKSPACIAALANLIEKRRNKWQTNNS